MTTTTKKITDYSDIRQGAMIFRAINHRLRQRIVSLLEDHGQATVTDIYTALRIDQSVASQHLAILRKAKIVNTERQGKYIFYYKNGGRLEFIQEKARELIS
jgi:DNA-binding transcriptional ArsR family regulator